MHFFIKISANEGFGVILLWLCFSSRPRNRALRVESLDEMLFKGTDWCFRPKNRGWNAEFLDEGALGRVIYGTRPKKWA